MIARIRYAVALLAVATAALPLSTTQAQQKKAVAVLSISSIDSVLDSVGYLTDAAGYAESGQMVKMFAGAYLEGIDRANPVGIVLTTDGQEFQPLGFVPVKDLEKVFTSLEESVGAPRDLGNGIKEIPGIQPIFVKEQDGFAFIGQSVESMGSLPKNPVAALGQMPKEYDIAIRGNIQNVPKHFLDMAVNALRDGVKQSLSQLPEDERAAQEEMINVQMKQMETYIKESDQITLGWKTSPAEQRTYLDITFTAVPGGDLAKQMNAMADAKSDFTGFLLPGAAVSLNVATEIPAEQIQTSLEAIEGVKKAALREIEKEEDLDSPEARKAAVEMVGAAMDILISTVKTGKMDGGLSVMLKPGDLSVLGGFHVADGKEIEKVLRRIEEMAKDEPDFPGINFNADRTSDGVAFHTMVVPVPEDEEARKVLGDTITMAVGTSADSAYVGFGKDCVAELKSIIESQPKQKKVPPFQLTVALTPIMDFVASIEDNPLVGSVADALHDAGDKDHVNLRGIPIENGFVYRIEVEEGILRGVGEAIKMANGGGF